METYLAPLCTLTSTPVALPGIVGINWLSVVAVILITAGQTISTRTP
jgi:hypothetical protein